MSNDSQSKLLETIKNDGIEFVDLRFTDSRGQLKHVTLDAGKIDKNFLEEGEMFDGSSIAGWMGIDDSDSKLMPDAESVWKDPFAKRPTICIYCDVVDPNTGNPYDRDPRAIARKAEAYLKSTGIGDACFMGQEAEFFMFNHARYGTAPEGSFYQIDGQDASWGSSKMMGNRNLGHQPGDNGNYFSVAPVNQMQDVRSQMIAVMKEVGLSVEKHHPEVGAGQHELGLAHGTLLKQADTLQKFKYIVHGVALQNDLTATFMPKPIVDQNGSGMHCNQSIWKEGKPLFAGDMYAGLSQEALWYIGGILKHAKALNAFTNPSTNSYKRLVPGYEAPVMLAYSAANRSASIRIPHSDSEKGRRIEVRFPDPSANGYLAFSAMLMAGLDGIQNKIEPGEPMDQDLYELPEDEARRIPTVCSSLRRSLEALEQDTAFLTAGGVFTENMLEAYIALKKNEVSELEMHPHPVEFQNYFSC